MKKPSAKHQQGESVSDQPPQGSAVKGSTTPRSHTQEGSVVVAGGSKTNRSNNLTQRSNNANSKADDALASKISQGNLPTFRTGGTGASAANAPRQVFFSWC